MVIMLIGVILAGLLLVGSLFGGRRRGNAQTRSAVTGSDKPNLIVFVVDDLDVRTMQIMLDNGLLPNIKSKIVEGAADFQNAIVPCSICAPSRASLLTGRYSHNHGVWHVLGDEGPQQFDPYLTRTANAYLPTWLGNEYYRAFVGKEHLGASHPNWDFHVPVDGYDLRPGNYKALENGTVVVPPVYQTKYIGDTAIRAIRGSGSKPLFLMVSTTGIHVNVTSWHQMGTLNDSSFGGKPVSFAQFHDDQTGKWRQHLVTASMAGGNLNYLWWERNSSSRDSGWGSWVQTGDDASVAPGTGAGAVAGWNVLCPSPGLKRQQLVRTAGANVNFYTRDITSGQPIPPWVPSGDNVFLQGTGDLPVVGWAAIQFPSGLIRQQIVRGDELYGFMSWVKYRLPSGGATDWRVDPDWGESVIFGRVSGFNLIQTEGARYLVQVLFQPPNSSRAEWWQSPELTDFQELAAINGPASLGRPAIGQGGDEGSQYLNPTMKYSGKSLTVSPRPDTPLNLSGVQTVEVSQVHPYFLMRAYPEGCWSPILVGQTYNWNGRYPAGSLRRDGDVNGFETNSPALALPVTKPSFNRQLESSLPFYSTAAWPELDQTVWAMREQEDYLRRLHLDRMEQMISVDRMVGEIVDFAGPNSIIIFTSDNGHYTGEHRLSNKLAPHEESIRVPLYIKVPGGQRRQVDRLVANIDIAPTLLEFAGRPWYSAGYGVDGRSLKGLVEKPSVTSWRRSLLVEFHRPRSNSLPTAGTDWRFGLPDYLALRVAQDAGGNSANSLYVQYYNDVANPNSTISFERYLLTVDPSQTNNVASGELPALDRMLRDFYVASGKESRIMDIKRVP